jgi:hypothetical protein
MHERTLSAFQIARMRAFDGRKVAHAALENNRIRAMKRVEAGDSPEVRLSSA